MNSTDYDSLEKSFILGSLASVQLMEFLGTRRFKSLCHEAKEYVGNNNDNFIKSQQWNGKVKSSKCKACEA
jgi:hypothetical protein